MRVSLCGEINYHSYDTEDIPMNFVIRYMLLALKRFPSSPKVVLAVLMISSTVTTAYSDSPQTSNPKGNVYQQEIMSKSEGRMTGQLLVQKSNSMSQMDQISSRKYTMKDGYDMGVKAASKVPLKRTFLRGVVAGALGGSMGVGLNVMGQALRGNDYGIKSVQMMDEMKKHESKGIDFQLGLSYGYSDRVGKKKGLAATVGGIIGIGILVYLIENDIYGSRTMIGMDSHTHVD